MLVSKQVIAKTKPAVSQVVKDWRMNELLVFCYVSVQNDFTAALDSLPVCYENKFPETTI